MELLKSRITRYRPLFDGMFPIEETMETIVPDTKPDVLRIACASAELCVKEKTALEERIRVTGEARVRVFYCPEDGGKMSVTECVVPFAGGCDVSCCDARSEICVSCELVSVDATILNSRKLSIRVRVCAHARVYGATEESYVCGVSCDPEDEINTLVEKTEQMAIVGMTERRISVNEDIRLSGSAVTATDRLYRCEVSYVTDDLRVLTNKIMLRGSIKVRAYAISDSGILVSTSTYMIPFSQIIDSVASEVGDEVTVDYQLLRCEARLLSKQEEGVYLACEIQSNASVLVTRAIPMEILSDLYSTAFITETEAVEVLAPVGEEKSRYDIPLEECIRPDYPAIRIADCSFISELSEWHACEETLRGFVCVRVLYETTTGALCGVNKRMNVECMLDAPMGQCDRAEICCGDMKAVCEENGEIMVKGTVIFFTIKQKTRKMQQICKCKIDKKQQKTGRAKNKLVLRCLEEDETVWAVAKKHNTTTARILAANRVASAGELTGGTLIIIPPSK